MGVIDVGGYVCFWAQSVISSYAGIGLFEIARRVGPS